MSARGYGSPSPTLAMGTTPQETPPSGPSAPPVCTNAAPPGGAEGHVHSPVKVDGGGQFGMSLLPWPVWA